MSDIWQDLKFGTRVLLRSPLLTWVAALSLGIGVGANTTVFTLVKAVFLKPLPVEDSATLVSIFRTVDTTMAGAAGGFIQTSFANYEDVEDRSEAFDDLTASTFGSFNIASGGEPVQVFGGYTTMNYFRTLGLQPALGRLFSSEDEHELVVVLSHGLWTRRFGARSDIVGESLRINGRPFEIVGVAPAGFKGTYTLANQELWVPVQLYPRLNQGFFARALEHRGLRLFDMVGRLASGVDRREAEAELQTIAHGLEEEHPEWNRGRSFVVLPLDQSALDPNQRGLYVRAGVILMGAVGLVLAIACANVATLLMSRSRSRRREIAMRLSLGASRARIARQLLTESLLLSAVGGLLGALIALWCRPLLWSLRPPFLPEGSLDLGLDLTVLAFTGLVALGAGVLFGIAPAWQAAQVDLVSVTKGSDDSRSGGRSPLRHMIVAAQAALSLVTLAAAGLFVVSLSNAYEIDPGFDHDRLALATFDLGAQNYPPDEVRLRFDRILEAVAALPGAERAALATSRPLTFTGSYRVIPLGADNVDDGVYVSTASVSPDYFRALGVSVVEGRAFDERDTLQSRHVVIVNETFVDTFWPGGSAVGRQVRWPAAEAPWDVVGVVRDMKYATLGEDPKPFFYRPLEQEPSPAATLHVRASLPPDRVLPSVMQELRRLEPELPVTEAFTVDEAVRQSLWAARLGATLLGVFGVLAVSLAAVGIYGVLAHAAESRRREIGIRVALGARRATIVGGVLRQGLVPVLLGVGIGVAFSFVTFRLAGGMLYDIHGAEPWILAGAAAALATVAVLACIIPAWKTTRIDPVETLKAS